jgi:7-alpha-hydroxysteroid dehydrogenase
MLMSTVAEDGPPMGCTAIVTGASRGIARALALTLAAADVVVAARSKDQLDALVDEVSGLGDRARSARA